MLKATRDNLSVPASCDNEEDGEDEEDEEDTELGKLSKDDEPGWVMGTISKTVQHRMENFWQKQMRLDELTQPGWWAVANYFRERDMKYGMAESMFPAVVTPQIDTSTATPAPTTVGKRMQMLDMVPGQSQMPHGTSGPGYSQMRLGSEKPQSHTDIASLVPNTMDNSSPIQHANPVEPVSCNRGILHP